MVGICEVDNAKGSIGRSVKRCAVGVTAAPNWSTFGVISPRAGVTAGDGVSPVTRLGPNKEPLTGG